MDEQGPGVKNIFNVRNLLAGLAVLFLIAIPVFWKFNNVPVTYQDFFAENFEPYSAPVPHVPVKGKPNSFVRAMKEYSNGNFSRSSNILKLICASDSASTMDYFYYGNSSLAENPPKTSVAIQSLQKVFEDQNPFQDAARWYLALSYLRHGNEALARDVLWEIAKQKKGSYQKSARKLIDDLMQDPSDRNSS